MHRRQRLKLKLFGKSKALQNKFYIKLNSNFSAYLKELLKEKKKFIVFGHHRVMLDGISNFLNKLKINFVRIDGSTRKQDRGEFIKTFQKNESCMVAVLSLGACNSGITLTAAEYIIFAELTWNPSVRQHF